MNKSRTTRWILLVVAAVGLGYFGWQRFHGEDQATTSNNAQKAARVAVRVTIAPVEKTDFPVYLNGLGTVQAFNTVVVRSRVDGQIDKIAFKEGQLVNQGDLLAEIDPRPYQATLDQATTVSRKLRCRLLASITTGCRTSHRAIAMDTASLVLPKPGGK